MPDTTVNRSSRSANEKVFQQSAKSLRTLERPSDQITPYGTMQGGSRLSQLLSNANTQQAHKTFHPTTYMQPDPADADTNDLMNSFLLKYDRDQPCETSRQSLFARSSACLQLAVNSTEAAKHKHLPRDRDGFIVSSIMKRRQTPRCERKFQNTA